MISLWTFLRYPFIPNLDPFPDFWQILVDMIKTCEDITLGVQGGVSFLALCVVALLALDVVSVFSGRQRHFKTHCTRTDISLLSSDISASPSISSAQRSAVGSRNSGRSSAVFSVDSETENKTFA